MLPPILTFGLKMVKATKLELIGNQFKVYYDDGSKAMAVPTQGTMWIVGASTGGGPVDPGTGDYAWPYNPETHVSDEFGLRADVGRWHEGIDWNNGSPAGEGDPIPAIGAGTVELAEFYGNFGNTVILNHGILVGGIWDGMKAKSLYAHMQTSPIVSAGSSVTKGQTLGPLGNTGASFGNHCHMEIHIMPPDGDIIGDYQNPNPAPPSNRTAVDPRIFMTNYNPSGAVLIS